LAMLLIAIGTELFGPFIAKQMIDVHIAGIEQPWYKTDVENDPAAVPYAGAHYKRADRFAAGEVRGDEARVLQVGRSFVFVPGGIVEDGERSITGTGGLSITRGDAQTVYEATVLTNDELFAFYRPEVGGILKL